MSMSMGASISVNIRKFAWHLGGFKVQKAN